MTVWMCFTVSVILGLEHWCTFQIESPINDIKKCPPGVAPTALIAVPERCVRPYAISRHGRDPWYHGHATDHVACQQCSSKTLMAPPPRSTPTHRVTMGR